MKIRNDGLQLLLHKTKRTQVIDNKTQDQVHSCVIRVKNSVATTTCLCKDGVSSLSSFSHILTDVQEDTEIYIPDISNLLGALKYHSKEVTLKQDVDKLRIKSYTSKKQTTLLASPGALAYSHTPKTMKEWEGEAQAVSKRITTNDDGVWTYTTNDGDVWEAKEFMKIDATDLFEALRCDSMNGQKVNRYRFFTEEDELYVETGGELRGKTKTRLYVSGVILKELDVVVQGGLEQLFSKVNGDVYICWFDFTSAGQGVKLLFQLGDEDFVLQSGLLR